MKCPSCGESVHKPPVGGTIATRCLRPALHRTDQPGQVWVWLGDHFEIRGTGMRL